MGPLAVHLIATVPVTTTPEEIAQWQAFKLELGTHDLEAALTKVTFSEALTRHVVSSSREFLIPKDIEVFEKLLHDRRVLPLSRLFRYFFVSTHKDVHVITPNYDRIAEYAADASEFSHFTGFSYGYLNTRSRDSRTRIHQNGEATRTVSIWKVHGSFDWFKNAAGQIVSLPSCRDTPADYMPVMITPGVEKYRLAYEEPFRTIMASSDNALEKARSYFCVGFGFNDQHLQTKLIERCEAASLPIVVITMELSPAAKAFLTSGRCRKFLALERSPTGTRMFSHTDPTGTDIPGQDIWQLDKFLDMAIGADT